MLNKVARILNLSRKLMFSRAPGCPFFKSAWDVAYNSIGPSRMFRRCSLVEADGDCELWNTPAGKIWIPKGGGRNVLAPLLAQLSAEIYGDGIKPRDVVIDCGAHVGLYTKRALESGASLVVALEPSPDNLRCLRRNLEEPIAAGKVIVVEQCVSDHSGTAVLQVEPSANSWETHLSSSGVGLEVSMTSLDDLVGELALQKVDFIKMDIEGAEQSSLAGAAHVIAQFHPKLAIAAYHLPNDPERIPELVKGRYKISYSGFKDAGHPRIVPDTLLFDPI